MIKFFTVLVALLISFNASATTPNVGNYKWYGPFTLEKAARYYNGSHKVTLHFKETPNTPCTVMNNQKMASYWSSGESFVNALYSAAATAQAQNRKVMIEINTECHATYGGKLYGVEILSE
ncbi:hypothetical protein [Marinomonas mediterranea]|nr:hypothetical protein [Marinomonas mediterranea]WCN08205.1 hypothetical protein GV055_04380 [Marinomonas mediterranea]WCN12272.1 hypothetical protein GV054_04280 [Marinomonas mediterranea]WCN16345.1 hypothetical protein GV053_04385 [Marinomonas mediterranea MMB-1]